MIYFNLKIPNKIVAEVFDLHYTSIGGNNRWNGSRKSMGQDGGKGKIRLVMTSLLTR